MKGRKILILVILVIGWTSCSEKDKTEILLFSKTNKFRHECIEKAADIIVSKGKEMGYRITSTEDASLFHYKDLRKYASIIFLNTSGNVLDAEQQFQFQKYIRSGGGFVGIHAATTTEYEWPWFGELVGGYFSDHPKIQSAKINVVDQTHSSTKHLDETWARTDEWYNYKYLKDDVNVLLTLDETSYEGGKHPVVHPIAWYHEYEGGKAFYTGLGHTDESYTEPDFLKHIFGGIAYTVSKQKLPEYVNPAHMPDENKFTRTILTQNLDEPMEMDIFPDGRIMLVERKGAIKLYDPNLDLLMTVTHFPVHTEFEDGLMGLAIDPNYKENNFIYLFYSPVGEVPVQHISRFIFQGNKLIRESEKVVLKIDVQRDECCHSGGGLEFGPDGLLYIGAGDDTNPFASDGFAPIDEREGRTPWDAQRSSGNTNDLRGKISRIKLNSDGSYDIPKGNLFPEGTPNTRPEIYTMGLRNPFRFDIDTKRNWLFWGDVGPDAGKDGELRGPKGFDGINLAKGPGNWGWPYIRGNHSRYYDYNFEEATYGDQFDPKNLINNSPNNTGLKNIPEANRYFIWYSYDESEDFPWVKTGGKNPMAGPVFYSDDFEAGTNTFPSYFEGKLLIYEWMRDWIYLIEFDDDGTFIKAEEFLPNSDFHNPIDMLFGPDGALYVLEYGEKWFAQNIEARINKIEFHADNHIPIAKIKADVSAGKSPIIINFNGNESTDFDGDKLTYSWSFDSDEIQSQAPNPSYNFSIPGTYRVKLLVTDPTGNKSVAYYPVSIGNDPPDVQITMDSNPYFWYGKNLKYEVKVADYEDGLVSHITPEKVQASIQYFADGQDMTVMAQGHQAEMEAAKKASGKSLIDASDCQSCHHTMEKVNGPSYFEIAQKYNESDQDYLAKKIIHGGGGAWGETVMSAHPQLPETDVNLMVDWILGLENVSISKEKLLPVSGHYMLIDHQMDDKKGTYVVMATYEDEGGLGQPAFTGRDQVYLTYPLFLAKDYQSTGIDLESSWKDGIQYLGPMQNDQYFVLDQVFLTDVQSIIINQYFPEEWNHECMIEIRVGSRNGKTLASFAVKNQNPSNTVQELTIPIDPAEGYQNLYFIIKNEDMPDKGLAWINTIEFAYGGIKKGAN